MSDIDNILDTTLDDLADMPEIKAFPPGVHICKLNLEIKEVNKKPAVFAKLTAIETAELATPTDVAPNAGDETQIMMILKNNDGTPNEFSQGQLKNILKKISEATGVVGSSREIIQAVEANGGIVIAATVGNRDNKQSGAKQTTLIKFEVQA